MATSTEIVLSGMSTARLVQALDLNKEKFNQRKRQANKMFELYAVEEDRQTKSDLYNLFELLCKEMNMFGDNVEMYQTALTKRINKYNKEKGA